MKPSLSRHAALAGVFLFSFSTHPFAQTLSPTAPPSDIISVTPGEWQAADGATIKLPAASLKIAPPETRPQEKSGTAPSNYLPRFEAFDGWPTDQGSPGPFEIGPASDQENTPIFGGLYRQLVPGSLKVTTEDGSKTFAKNQDYKLHPFWPQISNISDRLGKPGEGKLKATFTLALQRIDLIQLKDGKLSVKAGQSKIVCPVLPEPDAGAIAIAGIYIAPWRQRAGKQMVPKADIFPIRPFAFDAPVNPAAISKFTAKLRSGEPAKIAFMGDSVTLGAEAAEWTLNLWTEKNLAYPSRVVSGLRKKFPSAKIEPIQAVQGGTTSKVAPQFFEEKLAPQQPDLLLMAFGLNDANSAIGGKPRVSVEEYKEGLRGVIAKARTAGTEVMLVTPMQPSPFLDSGIADRIVGYRDAILALAKEENVACADVYSAWMHQADQGTPPFSQLHNWINHPGNNGHGVYATTILRFFTGQ